MAYIDEVVEKNKRYLTQAQVEALAAASRQYNVQNAAGRASAQASVREQYDTGYRGLQNMGLAGSVSGPATSGEVPRLKSRISAPFEDYNRRLRDVENQRLNALGGQFAQQTMEEEARIAAERAAAARRARAAAAAEAAAAEAAAAKAREERRISAGLRQTDMEATGRSGSTINSDPKRQRNVNMTDTASNGEREAEVVARARAAAEATRIGAGLHQTAREAAGLSGSSLNIGQNRQRNVNMTDTASNGEREAESAARSRAAVEAAAAVLGIATNKYNDAYTRAQMEANAGKASEVPTFKVQSGSTAAADLKRTQNVGMTDTASNRNNTGSSRRYATQGTTWSSQGGQVEGPSLKEVDDAIAVYESAVKAYEDTAGHGAPSEASREPINKANELLNSLGFASIYSAKRYRDSITNTKEPERSTEEPDYLVKARREMEDAQAKYESALAGTNTLQQQIVGILRKRSASKQVTEQDVQNVMRSAHAAYISGSEDEKKAVIDMVMEAYGFRPYGMDDDAYKRDIQKYRDIKQAMQLLQNKDAAGGEQSAILTLQRYGLTEEQASKWLKEFTEERDRRAEYNYYRPGILAQIEHQGEKPTGPVNEEEKDQRYRDVNGLPLGSNLYTAYFADRLPDNGQYMTDEQRNVYNAIYEREGIEAANQYLDDIQPYINLQRAAQDEEYYKQLAKEHPLAADALSVGQNLFGSMPAMAEKLTIGARNVIMGTEDPRYIDVNSRASRLSNAAGTIRGERTRLVQEGYYRNNATSWLHDKGLISDGMKNGLDAINKKEWVNNTLSFLYQSKMSMADSAVAMAVAWTGAPWMVDALFFSSAGNEAYKDARARGATQEEALGFSMLSGTAEALFEHVSIESFMDKFVNNTPQLAQNWLAKMLAQSLTEASEETCTEIATIFADMIAMGDKSEWARAAEAGPEEFNRFLRQKAEDVGMAGLGGFISGLAFGGFGTAMNATQRSKYGKTLLKTGQADQYLQQARLLGGDQLNYAADSFEKNKSRSNAAELGIRLEERIKELNEAKTPAVSKMDAPAALTMIQDGSEMTIEMGQAVLAALDSKTIESMGYKSSTAEAFAKSYNDRLNKYQITSRSNAMARTAERIERNAQDRTDPGYAPFIAQSPSKLGKAGVTMNADGTVGTRQDETNRIAQSAEAMDRLWKDPNLGYTYTEEGARVRNLPGNMTSVSYDEQRRSNFAPRTTVTVGRTTYQIAGMETREGLSDEQKITALKKNMAKGTLARAEFLESLADALKINMVIHDELNGTGGFLDGDDSFHISLASEQSILRVTSHELMHEIRRASQEAFTAVKDSLIKQIGQDTFDRKVEQKKREYAQMGVQLDQDGAIEETVAEYSERMLSDTDWLEDFVEENPEAARTMKDVLLKIVNAVKKAFKRIENRNHGTSWSQEIEYTRDTLQAMYKGLEAVMERAEKKAEERTSRQEEAENELYMDADTQRAEQAKKAVEESAQKKTYVRGYSAAEIERVLSAGVLGDKSNYEGNDYENARGMIAQLIPDIVSALNGEADIDEVNEKVKTAVGVMMDNYFEDEGNMAALREDIPDLIGVDATAKGDLKAQDQSLFQMSARLSKALGKRVTLVSEKNAKGQKNAKHRIAEKLEDLWTRTQERYGLSDDMDFSLDPQRLLDFIEQQADTRKTARELFGSSLQDEIDSISSDIIDAVADMYGKKTGQKFSLDTDALRKENKGMGDIRKEETYSYDNLVNQDPMFVYDMPALGTLKTGNSIDLEKVSDMGLKNAASVGEKVGETEYSIQNRYTKNQIRLSKNAIEHGLNVDDASRLRTNARLAAISGTIVKNAIPINAVTPKNKQASWAYVMCCLLNSGDRQFIAAVHVNQFTNAVENIDFKEVVHSVSGRITKEADRSSTRETGNNPATSASNISIADFLDIVNNTYRSILSQSVLNHYGEERPANGLFSKDAIYSLDTDSLRSQKEYEQKRDELYSSLTSAKDKLRKAEAKRKEVLESKEYNDAVEAVTKAKGDELDAAIKKYVAFMNESGANGAQREIDALKKDVERLSKEFDDLVSGKQQSDRVRAIEKSGLSEQDYDRKQAGKEFGYTPYFYDAGYMLPDGKLLNFSGEKGRHFGTRGQDHRAIGTIYEDSKGSEAMIRFMNGGNIRVMAETPGIDISNVTEPTREQYAKIRSFAQESAGKRFFNVDISDENGNSVGALTYDGRVSPDKVVNDIKHYFETGEIRQQSDVSRFLYSLDTDAAREARQAFTVIDTAGIEDGLEALKNVKNVGAFAMKDISRFLDAISHSSKDEEANKNLRNTLSAIFEKPHSEATGRYARGVERMQQRVLDIGAKAGVCDEKGGHFDSKKSAAIQNIGEGFSNTYTDLKLKVKDADRVTVRAYETGTDKLVVSEKDYTLKELRQAYGTNVADFVWGRVFDETQKAQASGKEAGWLDETVNTRPYTLADLQDAFPRDWQQLKTAADEFRQMYDEYIRDQNNMLRTIYPIASEYESVEKVEKAISKKQERLARHKVGVEQQIQNLQKSLEAKEKEMAGKKRTDTKAFRNLVEQANRITDKIATVKAEIAEYEANINEELAVMNAEKAQMQNAVQSGESLKRMHRLQYRSDYFHHFQEMASGVQNLKAIFTNNTDISPAIVGKSENTKAKSRWAGYYQQRMGADYTADAMNGMLRYGQLAEYKLAFDPLVSYLRNVTEQIRTLDDNTNRDGLIKYLMAWTDNIAGKSHRLDRLISDAGMAPRKAMQVLNWINSRVIQNTLLFNMRSSLIQISNITNAKGIVTNNLDWFNGLRCWAAASKGNEAMQAIMAQSNFLASRYMDNMELTDSALKSAKKFAGWMLGALDEVSAKATWWAAYTQYQRNPNAKVIQNAYRAYDNAVDYADDVTRRTHAGRGVGELAPAMTSRVINFVAPFQVEVNNTFELFKDNIKRGNYLGLLSTGLSVFLFNAAFEAIVGSSPLQFDFIRAVLDIVLGFKNDDPDEDDDDYGLLQAWQRIAGEGIGSLPFAGQLVSIIGEDTAKKIFGEDNDATRYGNTQIGVSAVTNAGKGLYDIGKNMIEGKNVKQVNWISDLDDLVNLTLPMGGKQLTRSIQGLYTVAQGYGGKNDKEGKEQVQFVTDQDILHYIHGGLFGKWALTEASEYFGEERLLPRLFGAYEGPKSSMGQTVNAKEYKAALETGIDGKQFFSLKYDLKEYTTQPGKRAEMMEQDFTPEQKAKLDALLIPSSTAEVKADGAIVYQKDSDGEWKVKADYTNRDMFELSQNGDKTYTGTLAAMEKTGLPQDQAVLAASMWEQAKAADDSKAEFRSLLKDNDNLTVAQKEALDLQYCGNKYAADYSDPDLFELSTTNRTTYEKAKQAKAQGIPVKNYVSLLDKKNEYSGEDKADYMRREIMKGNLTEKQKALLDDLLVSDKGRNPDYSSPAWFEISMLGGGQYQEAKEGAKIGLKPETYLTIYNKWKTLDAKDENGKTVNGLKKKRAKEYMDSLSISAPEYDYVWTVVFGYKTK